ncbi:hypothetical protein HYPSUDRAFT_162515 [Hypholoma sublateritium FD-334 SS-4]|uniref:Uncharacterized protein n=1 Tax=Hypholoma sublateritium (strain FD-334 SS-4) TaxID=945553 RepID=A0A0D2P5N0_HYPSF|nr:hypothetical protein HYPSUDRAFT_162515 [Hypholoma sublateritium FD-334 SS-4]
MNGSTDAAPILNLNEGEVPLRTGPPTREELLRYYPAKFSWTQLKTFVNSGDLGLLKRDRELQKRYEDWAEGVKLEYGSIVKYLANHRLRWGQPDTQSLLQSSLEVEPGVGLITSGDAESDLNSSGYFCCETPSRYISIIQNDWPYSVPPEVEHTLIWTKVPIYHPKIVAESVKSRIDQDGLWGFTSNEGSPPSSENLVASIGALSEWGITLDRMVKSEPPTKEEASLVERAGSEVHRYVQTRWSESEWETAWFVNPPRLQSVPGLAHIHVFARRK